MNTNVILVLTIGVLLFLLLSRNNNRVQKVIVPIYRPFYDGFRHSFNYVRRPFWRHRHRRHRR